MADAVISIVAERVAAIIEDQIRYQVNLVRGVEKKVLDLSNKLETIRSVLDDAEKRGVNEQSVKKWLKKLEDVAYEMDDILDEWNYTLLKHKMEECDQSTDPTVAPAKQKVCFSFIPSSSCLCFKKVGVRRDTAIKIQNVKDKLDQIIKEKDEFDFVKFLPTTTDVVPKALRVQSTSSVELEKVYGRDEDRDKIARRVMLNDDSQVVSIVGMGGLGKSTLAQLVYNDTQVKECFDLRIWICVSNPFDVAGIARGIIESVTNEIIPRDTNQLELVLEKLRDCISGKKFLLVLDDVWTEIYEEWEPLKINLGHGAEDRKILVTTRNERVAKMMGALEKDIFHPRLLTDKECWALLRHISLSEKSEEEFEDVGKNIAKKCKGLPLAAKVLGSLLQFKNSLEEWENVLESEIWRLEESNKQLFPHLVLSYNELSPALKRCFSYCGVYPKDSEINAERLIEEWMALGYLGSVGGNGGVELKGRDYFNNLAMRSLFQDIEESDDGSIVRCKMHDIVHDFALFLRGDNNRLQESSCQVCSPLIVSRVQEYRNLVWGAESHMDVCDCITSVRVLRFEPGGLYPNGPPQGMKKLIHLRWLKLSGHEMYKDRLKMICRFYFLQTLLLSCCSIEEIPIEIGNLVELRHLDLSYNDELKELPGEIGNLIELRHLDLSYNRELRDLPGEIGNLVQLRHLDLSCNDGLTELPESMCSLVELRFLNLNFCNSIWQGLPEGIHRLRNLQHLHINNTFASHRFPRGLGELSGLRTLGTHFHGGIGRNKLGLLKTLNRLTGTLSLIIHFRDIRDLEVLVEDAREAELRNKIHISSIIIHFDCDERPPLSPSLLSSSLWMDVMEALEPNQQKLNELKIMGCGGYRLPQWISSPLNLVKDISLRGFDELSSLPPFGKLPFLEVLRMEDMEKLKFVGREFLGIESSSSSSSTKEVVVAFPKLEQLSIIYFPKWLEWEDITAEEEESNLVSIMPRLEELHVKSCKGLKKLPHRLLRKASSSLRILKIGNSPVLESQYGDKDGSQWRSISQDNSQLQLRLN